MIKTYSELITFKTFEERFEYLKLSGMVGSATFGSERFLNQSLYSSKEWADVRDHVIIRDNGCDLAFLDRPIYGAKIYVHHMNPLTIEDILQHSKKLFDPENLITTIKITHDAIHYGDSDLLIQDYQERTKYDTCPWRK